MGVMALDNPDEQNADFWDEPCGMAFAGQRGYDIDVPAGLDGFDQAYFEFYPYLRSYVDRALADATSVVEVGLGLGTTSRYMARKVDRYLGIDVAGGPCRFVERSFSDRGLVGKFLANSILRIQPEDVGEQFDAAVAIGSLHHTGDLSLAVKRLEALVKPGGKILIMVYNEFELRRILERPGRALGHAMIRHKQPNATWPELDEKARSANDTDSSGRPAPFTNYSTKRTWKTISGRRVEYRVTRENFHAIPFRRAPGGQLPRKWMLGIPARIAGTDLYVEGAVPR